MGRRVFRCVTVKRVSFTTVPYVFMAHQDFDANVKRAVDMTDGSAGWATRDEHEASGGAPATSRPDAGGTKELFGNYRVATYQRAAAFGPAKAGEAGCH